MSFEFRVPGFGRRAGVVLIGALWVMAFLALVVVSYVASQGVELKVAGAHADRSQALHLASSGIEHAKFVLMADETAHDGPFEEWLQDPEMFERVALGDGFFSLIRPNTEDAVETAHGLEDECAKVNLNTAPVEVLKELPGMSDALAEAIVDWRDEDDEVTGEGGAESDHYMRLDPPYEVKNAPFDTVEELLLVKDFTTEVLYGEDGNRNGVLDPNEDDGDESLPPDDHDGELDGGLVDFVTVYSYTPNMALDGQPRVNINEAEKGALQQRLGELLPEAKITWIMEYRKAKLGGESVFPDEKYVTPANVVPLFPVPGVQGQPLTFGDYRKIADLVTVESGNRIEGKINVNTARKEVLEALPQITDEEVDTILAERENEE
ncbi:MAG: type II secretion system minor pseudopilin, partial [Planctomycetota bacterium]